MQVLRKFARWVLREDISFWKGAIKQNLGERDVLKSQIEDANRRYDRLERASTGKIDSLQKELRRAEWEVVSLRKQLAQKDQEMRHQAAEYERKQAIQQGRRR